MSTARRGFILAGALSLWLQLAPLAPAAQAAVVVILVRHAEREQAPPSDPPLSPAGRRRAEALANTLADAGVTAIYTSQYRRTRETTEPVARRLRLTPEIVPAADSAKLVAAIRQHSTGTILVAGHSNSVPEIIALLGGPKLEIADDTFDNLFAITLAPGPISFLRLHYGEPSPPPTTHNSQLPKGQPVVMQIKFVRSGGFAGDATKVEGTVNFDENGAHVTADSNYRHELPAGEADQLRQAAQAPAAQSPPPMPDAFQYQVSVVTSDGKTHKNANAPALLQWVKDEANKIWTHKTSQ